MMKKVTGPYWEPSNRVAHQGKKKSWKMINKTPSQEVFPSSWAHSGQDYQDISARKGPAKKKMDAQSLSVKFATHFPKQAPMFVCS